MATTLAVKAMSETWDSYGNMVERRVPPQPLLRGLLLAARGKENTRSSTPPRPSVHDMDRLRRSLELSPDR